MIKGFIITNYKDEILELPLSDPSESGFLVTDVTGLGPIKADIHVVESATMNGAIYNSARAQSRNIVFSLMFISEKKTIEELRLDTYRYFPLKQKVSIIVETDTRVAEIDGYVESNEPEIFSDSCGCQISIICPDSYFHANGVNRTTICGVDPLFHFVYSNESVIKKLTNFGEILEGKDAPVYNTGDEEVGVTIILEATGPVSGFIISNVTTGESMGIDDTKLAAIVGNGGISSGDEIRICTERGHKTAILRRNGIRYNILNALSTPIQWINLQFGVNVFTFLVTTGQETLNLVIENKVLYEGV